MTILQQTVKIGKKFTSRGWTRLLRTLPKIYKKARMYPATMSDGDVLFIDLREDMCLGYFYHGGQPHEYYTSVLFDRVLTSGSVFVDVGANIGFFTRFASKRVGSEGHVYAFEPLPAAIPLLEANTKGLRNVSLHKMAVGERCGDAAFSINTSGDMSSLGCDPMAKQHVTVQLTTLDTELGGLSRIDVIKIDVEGYEMEVLMGAKRLLEAHHPLLYFEYLQAYGKARGIAVDDFKSFLSPLGYDLFWINDKSPEKKLIGNTPSSYLIGLPQGKRFGFVAQ